MDIQAKIVEDFKRDLPAIIRGEDPFCEDSFEKLCWVFVCDGETYSHGLCKRHYDRFRRASD